jgi:hypothetical protein
MSLSEVPVKEQLQLLLTDKSRLLLPGSKSTWRQHLTPNQHLIMYCPLFDDWDQDFLTAIAHQMFLQRARYDLSILEVVNAIDAAGVASQKD